jgi:HSP20 family molecular chaperone IbpA
MAIIQLVKETPKLATTYLSNKIDQSKISAQLDSGVLTLTLPKAKEALPRRITLE